MHKKNIFLLLGLVSFLSSMNLNEMETTENGIHEQCLKTIKDLQKNLEEAQKQNKIKLTFTQKYTSELILGAAVGGALAGHITTQVIYPIGKMLLFDMAIKKQFFAG